MATGYQNMSTNPGSQISSINTYRITKGYYPAVSPTSMTNKNANLTPNVTPNNSTPSPAKSAHLDSSTVSSADSGNDNSKKTAMYESYYVDLNQQQSIENVHQQNLKIKTKSIESTLLPLVNQITTLVNFKDSLKFSNSDRTGKALLRVGQAVEMAVSRFVQVGEKIANENPTIKYDMLVACSDAKDSGAIIKTQTHATSTSSNKHSSEKIDMIQAANTLLNSVTKVLLLADVVIINQLLSSKNQVLHTLNKLENVIDFWNFVNYFTQYGQDLIDLAHLSGERQNDLKDEKLKFQLSSARWILEKSTSMILSASKAYLKHLECECAKENICLVYSFLQEALDIVHYVAIESGTTACFKSPSFNAMFKNSPVQISFTNAYRQFEDALDLANNNLLNENDNYYILNSLNAFIDTTQDFTDSLYISNDQREKILQFQSEIKNKTLSNLKSQSSLEKDRKSEPTETSESDTNSKKPKTTSNQSIQFKGALTVLADCETLKKLLQAQTMLLANSLFRQNEDATLLNLVKTYSASNHYDLLIESLDKFKEYSDHVLEIVKLLRHMSSIDVFEVTCEHHYNVFEYLSKMIQSAAGTAALYPQCKSAMENLYLYCDSWESQINDLSILVKEMQDWTNSMSAREGSNNNNSSGSSSKPIKSVYFSLPRPGKHGNGAREASLPKASRLDSEEQAKIAKIGLEMKLVTTEIEVEADKWNEPQNEIVKVAKSMSEMAYEIHLFTRGEGSLKTTQDLFNKAQQFLNLGVILNSIIKDFLVQVPAGHLKEELVQLRDKLPSNFKQLKSRLKQVTVGKAATFNKVDWVIQETRNFMNLVAKLVTSCFLCCTKYNISYENTEQFNGLNSTLELLAKNTTPSPKSDAYNSNRRATSSGRADSCGPIPYRSQSENQLDHDS